MANVLAQLTSYFGAFLISSGKLVLYPAPHKPQYKHSAEYRIPVISGLPSNLTTMDGSAARSLPPLFAVLQPGQQDPTCNVGCEKNTSVQPSYAFADIRPWFALGFHWGVRTFFGEHPPPYPSGFDLPLVILEAAGASFHWVWSNYSAGWRSWVFFLC